MTYESGQEHTTPAWREGKEAFTAGKLLADCPYEYPDDRKQAWEQGWEEAMYREHNPPHRVR